MGNCLSLMYIYFITDDDQYKDYKPLPDNDTKELSPVSSPRTLGSPFSNISECSDLDGDQNIE